MRTLFASARVANTTSTGEHAVRPRHLSMIVGAFLGGLVLSFAAVAQTWPVKTVTIVVPYPPGGGIDPIARLIGQKLSERLKQQFIVDNKPGASGMVGAAYVARSAPDGYTLMISQMAEIVVNQHLVKSMAYNPEVDFAPVTLIVKLPFILAAHPSMPFKTVDELVAYARKNPGKLSYSSSGPGSAQHLAGEMLKRMAGIEMVHIPYKGVVPAISDMIGGQVQLGFAGLPTALPYVQSGKLLGLGVSSKGRAAAAPNIPPIAEAAGLGEFELIQWMGLFVPAKTPTAIVQKLQQEVATVLRLPDIEEKLLAQGYEPVGNSSAEFADFVKAERAKVGRIVRESNITAD